MSEYEKENKRFKNRNKNTTTLFPHLSPSALAKVLDLIESKVIDKNKLEEKLKETKLEKDFQNKNKYTEEEFQNLLKFLNNNNFKDLYAIAIEKSGATYVEEELKITDGV